MKRDGLQDDNFDLNFDPAPSHPRCSMYGIFTYIWVIFRANVGKYSIHGAYGHFNLNRDGLQDDNFDNLGDDNFHPNFDPAPSHFNLNRDNLGDDNFQPNYDPALSHLDSKQDGLHDDKFFRLLTLRLSSYIRTGTVSMTIVLTLILTMRLLFWIRIMTDSKTISFALYSRRGKSI